jgi:hypothetical protein
MQRGQWQSVEGGIRNCLSIIRSLRVHSPSDGRLFPTDRPIPTITKVSLNQSQMNTGPKD